MMSLVVDWLRMEGWLEEWSASIEGSSALSSHESTSLVINVFLMERRGKR